MSCEARPSVSAILVAYGHVPTLERCLDSLRKSTNVDLELVVVDNGVSDETSPLLDAADVRRVGPARNRGFAGGCNEGVARSAGTYVALINCDAYVEPEALRELIACLEEERDAGIAMASLRLADRPSHLNSAGNAIHPSGLSWVTGLGEPAPDDDERRDVTGASGAAMAIHRSTWDELGGFDSAYFAYLEDAELSLRTWMSGRRVIYEPRAVALHDYDFSRHPSKLYLVERNRHYLVATLWEGRTLLRLMPLLLLMQLAMLAQSAAGGWFRQKLRADLWVLQNLGRIRARRRVVARARRVPDSAVLHRLEPSLTPPNVRLPPGIGVLNVALRACWRLVRP